MMSRVLGGSALVLAALLNLTRMIPVFANLPEGFEGFPPQSAAQIALLHVGNLGGVVASHVMALVSFPLYLLGFLILFSVLKAKNQQNLGLSALIPLGFGLFLFSIAVVIDGFILHRVAAYFASAPESSADLAAFLVTTTHEAALSFMAPALFAQMLGLALLALALTRAPLYTPWMSWLGVGIGTLAVLGYLTGLTGVYWDQMQFAGLLILLHHVWYVWLGVALLRHR